MRTTGNQCPVATPSELTANQPISSVSAQLLEPPALHALQPARYLAAAAKKHRAIDDGRMGRNGRASETRLYVVCLSVRACKAVAASARRLLIQLFFGANAWFPALRYG